jgi:hypothetical protein
MLLRPEVSKSFRAGTVSANSVPFNESPLIRPYPEPHKSGSRTHYTFSRTILVRAVIKAHIGKRYIFSSYYDYNFMCISLGVTPATCRNT